MISNLYIYIYPIYVIYIHTQTHIHSIYMYINTYIHKLQSEFYFGSLPEVNNFLDYMT